MCPPLSLFATVTGATGSKVSPKVTPPAKRNKQALNEPVDSVLELPPPLEKIPEAAAAGTPMGTPDSSTSGGDEERRETDTASESGAPEVSQEIALLEATATPVPDESDEDPLEEALKVILEQEEKAMLLVWPVLVVPLKRSCGTYGLDSSVRQLRTRDS